MDRKLVASLSSSKIPNYHQLRQVSKYLSPREVIAVRIFFLLIIFSTAFIIYRYYTDHFLLLPAAGGEYTEALVGSPQYINPILSETNDVDMDISRLVFSGLLKYDTEQQLVCDLCDHYEIGDGEKTYTFYLKEGLKWHDGEDLNADDIVFTIRSIKDPAFKSSLYRGFADVVIEKVDDHAVRFSLNEPYAPFLTLLTVGIIPQHVWGGIPAISANLAHYNLQPIGSGPFKFKALVKDKLGNIKSYALERSEFYYEKKTYLDSIVFKFYPSFEEAILAIKNREVQGMSYLPVQQRKSLEKKESLNYYYLDLPQYTAIFFNQDNNEALKDKNVRQALAESLDKNAIIEGSLDGQGNPIDSPILEGVIGYNDQVKKYPYNVEEANKILDEAGYSAVGIDDYKKEFQEKIDKLNSDNEEKQAKIDENSESLKVFRDDKEKLAESPSDNEDSEELRDRDIALENFDTKISAAEEENTKLSDEIEKNKEQVGELEREMSSVSQLFFRRKDGKLLSVTLTTVNRPENLKVLGAIKTMWEKAGFKVKLAVVEKEKMQQDIIHPRNYEALLYGEIVGADPDPYPFWHSSQRGADGLNLAMYSNEKVDELLISARRTSDHDKRAEKYVEFQNILAEDLPAVFLYNPTYTYVVGNNIKGISAKKITVPADRFIGVEDWYMKESRQWKD